MIIYHGTNFERLESIKAEGIRPRKEERKTKWANMPSHKEMVYLSMYTPLYYATHGLKNRNTEKGIVLEIEIDDSETDKLYPDEDYLYQSKIINGKSTKDIKKHKDKWEDSLNKLGNVCYKGIIDKNRIKRYCTIDFSNRQELTHSILTVEPSLEHHSRLKDKGGTLIKWLFGDTDELYELIIARVTAHDLGTNNNSGIEKWKKESTNREGIEVHRIQD